MQSRSYEENINSAGLLGPPQCFQVPSAQPGRCKARLLPAICVMAHLQRAQQLHSLQQRYSPGCRPTLFYSILPEIPVTLFLREAPAPLSTSSSHSFQPLVIIFHLGELGACALLFPAAIAARLRFRASARHTACALRAAQRRRRGSNDGGGRVRSHYLWLRAYRQPMVSAPCHAAG